MAQRRVVITGRGVVSPLGVGVEEHWASIVSARAAVRRLARLSTLGFPVDFAAEVSDEALKRHSLSIPRRQLKLFNRATLLGMIASAMAVEEAGLKRSPPDPAAFGVLLGTLLTAYDLRAFLQYLSAVESDQVPNVVDLAKANTHCLTAINPVDFSLKVLPNLVAGHIAIAFNAQGLLRTLADGYTAGLQAIGQAYWAIKEGQLEVALCGGTEAPLEEQILADLCAAGLLAEEVRDPATACRPFDAGRNGYVLGEGAGVLILEERGHALRRGARVYGEVLGFGASAGDDALFEAPSVDQIKGRLVFAMRRALSEATLDGRPDFIHANGDSTLIHDWGETEAIKAVFGPAAEKIPVSATKSLHGHLISASGAVELLTCLLALERGILPPIINYECPDPRCDLDYVVNRPRPNPGMKAALLNAVGIFGEAASLLVRR